MAEQEQFCGAGGLSGYYASREPCSRQAILCSGVTVIAIACPTGTIFLLALIGHRPSPPIRPLLWQPRSTVLWPAEHTHPGLLPPATLLSSHQIHATSPEQHAPAGEVYHLVRWPSALIKSPILGT